MQRNHPGQVFRPRGTLSLSMREEDQIVRACIGLAALVSQSGTGGAYARRRTMTGTPA